MTGIPVPSSSPAIDSSPRHVLMTGVGAGVGIATACRFNSAGDRITILAHNEQHLKEARDRLKGLGISTLAVSGSTGDGEDVQRFLADAEGQHGPIEVLVINAAVGTDSPAVEMSVEGWSNVVDANLKDVFLTSRAAADGMIQEGIDGVILITVSISILIRPPAVAHGAKAALEAYTRALAVELGPRGIRVCGVHPGYIETSLPSKSPVTSRFRAPAKDRIADVPLGRMGMPEEVASVLYFLASSDASYITGANVVVDGGRAANS